ncbi:hypothetical protein [Lederbergia citrea]|uniref:Uncharacterized protein n=1 Tax=Lederbergia citrea TaxID=2833581 RepID=A0A942UMX5_9BACI|nr:hypothetical protein [Lederbergia citrea]MBS4223610.1 hypothetical protein [Lederbergia citrea]
MIKIPIILFSNPSLNKGKVEINLGMDDDGEEIPGENIVAVTIERTWGVPVMW